MALTMPHLQMYFVRIHVNHHENDFIHAVWAENEDEAFSLVQDEYREHGSDCSLVKCDEHLQNLG